MRSIPVFIEEGRKKTFAGALGWPGWCRFGKDRKSALGALLHQAPRYQQITRTAGLDFEIPENIGDFQLKEEVEGNATTSFGAPAIILESDRNPAAEEEYHRWRSLLQASWEHFDASFHSAQGKDLQTGPRGGGRDLERILAHVIEADLAYLKRAAVSYKIDPEKDLQTEIQQIRDLILQVLDSAEAEGLPEEGPRGGVIWPVRFFIKRVIWHTLDHLWEIEDRLIEN